MGNSRREFIKKSATVTALSTTGFNISTAGISDFLKEADLEICLSYFFGFQEQKMQLAKQMGVTGAVTSSNPGMVGLREANPWEYEPLKAIKDRFEKEGLEWKVLEGPPHLDKVKLGLEGRDEEIDHFITCMKNLNRLGMDIICYNWMPVISWHRSATDILSRGDAIVTGFNYEDVKDEPLTEYGEITHEVMWRNLEYFLKAVVPEAEKYGIKLALHPDDPPVDNIRGIARIMTSFDAFKRLIEINPSPYNGITLCQGTFTTMGEDIPSVIEYFGKREKIFFVHFRDIKGTKHNFVESFHDDGKTDMYKAMKGYYEVGFRGPIRPDHVPAMAGDSNRYPGYSTLGTLFAIGYMRGLMEAVENSM